MSPGDRLARGMARGTSSNAPPGRVPAARLVRRQRRLPLSRPVLRRAAVSRVGVLGVAWLRIASAALIFAPGHPAVAPASARRRDRPPAARGLGACLAADELRASISRSTGCRSASSRPSSSSARSASRSAGLRTGRNLARPRARRRRRLRPDRRPLVERSRIGLCWRCSTACCSSPISCSATRIARAGAGQRRRAPRRRDGGRLPGRPADRLSQALAVPSPIRPCSLAGDRRRRLLVGHPLCLRPAGDVAAAARQLRAAAGAAAGQRHDRRRRRARTDSVGARPLGIALVMAASRCTGRPRRPEPTHPSALSVRIASSERQEIAPDQ